MESLRALNSKDKKKRQEWDEMTTQYLIDVHGHEMIVWQEETDEKIKKQSDKAEVEKEEEDEDWGDDSAALFRESQGYQMYLCKVNDFE